MSPYLPYLGYLGLEGGYGLRRDIMAGDDLLQRVEEEVLSLGIVLNLLEDKREVPLQIAGTDTACGEGGRGEEGGEGRYM